MKDLGFGYFNWVLGISTRTYFNQLTSIYMGPENVSERTIYCSLKLAQKSESMSCITAGWVENLEVTSQRYLHKPGNETARYKYLSFLFNSSTL